GSSIADPLTMKSGTSMATPHVTGAIALFLEKNNTLAVEDIAAKFANRANDRDGADPKPADTTEYPLAYGGGMLDVLKTLQSL
ncbi:MAG TPA: S8 family serine peptidase, partial [Bacteroidota bacterium]|nr:S8 family serine peptidase [Bacteroidota bacterium]